MSVIRDVDATPPWQLVLTSLFLILLPEGLALALFSSIGIADRVAKLAADDTMDMVGNAMAGGCALLIALAFVLDVNLRGVVVQAILGLFIAASFVATSALKFIGYPWWTRFAESSFHVLKKCFRIGTFRDCHYYPTSLFYMSY